MTSQHTPGPWIVDPADIEVPRYSLDARGNEDGDRVYTVIQDVADGWGIAEIDRFSPEGDNLANAALIAAAPVMLEALEDAARLVGLILAGDEAVDTADLEATYNGINAALAKAEGR